MPKYKQGYNPKDDPMYYRAWNPLSGTVTLLGFALGFLCIVFLIAFSGSGLMHKWTMERVHKSAYAPKVIEESLQGEPRELQNWQHPQLYRTT